MRGKIELFGLDTLINMIGAAGQQVEMRILGRGPIKASGSAAQRSQHKVVDALAEIIDTQHAGRIHLCPRSLKRTRQIDRPAPGLNQYRGEAEPARVDS